jgi:ketosteroid isomerase-like protein
MVMVQMIQAFEDRLAAAMLARDVAELGLLIDDALVFTGPDGNVIGKSDDLAAYRNGVLQLDVLERFETALHRIGELICVTTRARLSGAFADKPFSGTFAYTRLWRESGTGWRVIVGQAARVS